MTTSEEVQRYIYEWRSMHGEPRLLILGKRIRKRIKKELGDYAAFYPYLQFRDASGKLVAPSGGERRSERFCGVRVVVDHANKDMIEVL